jgi:hypothetical protein
MNNQNAIKETGWVDPEKITEENLGIEDIYDYSAMDLTAERMESLEFALQWPQFFNPLDADTSEISPRYFPDNLGDPIFAPGLIHWLYGPSETGKSFIALTACLQNSGVYMSLEMGARQMGTRVRKMNFHFLDSSRFLFIDEALALKEMFIALRMMHPTVVVIDSFGELALLYGADTNNDQEVGRIIKEVLKPLAAAGHSVIVVDHIAKNPGNIDYPLGTQNKKSQSDVCIYVCKDGTSGMLEMIITKDRYYIYGGRFSSADRKYGTIELTDNPTRAKIHRLGHEEYMPIAMSSPVDRQIQDSIMKLLKEGGPIQKSHIRFKVAGSDKKIDKALDQLLQGGWITIRKGKNAEGYSCRIVALTDKPWTNAPQLFGGK